MLLQHLKTTLFLLAAIICLGIALFSSNIFISKICASLCIITLATGAYAMQDNINNSIKQ